MGKVELTPHIALEYLALCHRCPECPVRDRCDFDLRELLAKEWSDEDLKVLEEEGVELMRWLQGHDPLHAATIAAHLAALDIEAISHLPELRLDRTSSGQLADFFLPVLDWLIQFDPVKGRRVVSVLMICGADLNHVLEGIPKEETEPAADGQTINIVTT